MNDRAPEKPFRVDCQRLDGTARIYAAYPTRELAEAAAKQLRAVGLAVVVHGPDDSPSEVSHD